MPRDRDRDDGAGEYLGPYERWSYGAGRPYAFPAIREPFDHVGALAEFDAPAPVPFAARPGMLLPTLWSDGGRFLSKFLPFVQRYRQSPGQSGLAALSACMRDCAGSSLGEGAARISRFRINFPVDPQTLEPAFVPRATPAPGGPAAAGTVVVGVIDDGIPFAHRNLRRADGVGSRVDHCWVQSAPADRDGKCDVLFGREFTRERIEALIAAHGADEDRLYREAGVTQALADLGPALNRPATHGALVLDALAGERAPAADEEAGKLRIVAVQLPNTIAWDTSGFGKDMFMLAALHYIFDRADRIANDLGCGALPLVVNFSYGFSGGPHDGGSELEAAMDEMVAARRLRAPTALVMPSGNTFPDRLHARLEEERVAQGAAILDWRLQPNDRTPSYLEMWFPQGFDPSGYGVRVIPPEGGAPVAIPVSADPAQAGGDPRRFATISDRFGRIVGQLSADRHRFGANAAGGRDRWRVMVALAPSEPDTPGLPAIAAGVWRIALERGAAASPLPGPVMCWIQRDADPDFFRSGSRQSYFDDAANRLVSDQGTAAQTDTPGSVVRRFGTLSGLATGRHTTVVGGYNALAAPPADASAARPSSFASCGPDPAIDGLPAKVAVSAPADRYRERLGVVGAGTRSGGLAALAGTSIAAPAAARLLARAFATRTARAIADSAAGNYAALIPGIEVPAADTAARARLGERLAVPER